MSVSSGNVAIYGATGGVGRTLARRLAVRGAGLALIGRRLDAVEDLRRELQAEAAGSLCVGTADAMIADSIEQALANAFQTLGRLDAVVYAVGTVLLKPAHLTTDAQWTETLAINLTGAFAVVRAAARLMPHGGSIVLFSSAAARIGLANHEAIAAAKAGVIGLAQSAAATYASRGLRFNVVAPGLLRTNMTRMLWESPASAAASQSMHALSRLGEADDVARMVEWLVDPANSWVTGQVFGVDGGLASIKPPPVLHAAINRETVA